MATRTEFRCPYCGTDTNPKDGLKFADHGRPGYSLGNHKRSCPSKTAGDMSRPLAAARLQTRREKREERRKQWLAAKHEAAAQAPTPVPVPAEEEPTTEPVVADLPWDEPKPQKRGWFGRLFAPPDDPKAPPPVQPSTNGTGHGYVASLTAAKVVKEAEFVARMASYTPKFSPAGLKLMTLLKQLSAAKPYPIPVALLGGTGLGKTVAVNSVALDVGYGNVLSTNLTPATRIEQLIGMPVPVNGEMGVVLEWADGIVLEGARHGWAVVLEEITRSPETMARLFSVTDQMGRNMPTPENPFEREVPVHERFWLLASGNPVGGGYQTSEMDVALRSRFFMIECNEPLADELAILTDILPTDPKAVESLMNFTTDIRKKGEVMVATRDVIMAAQAVRAGAPLKDAVHSAIVLKHPKRREGLDTLVKAHF